MSLIANARMYAVNPVVAEAWAALFAWVSRRAEIPLTVIPHAAPSPLEALWNRDDLGLGFICGYPFATGRFPVQPIAAPVPLSLLADGRPIYATHLVVRADSTITTLQQSFGCRIGWTVEHSQSGFNALRAHLLPHRRDDRPLYAAGIGPLLTPRRIVDAVLAGAIDIGPLDSYWYDLLLAHEPETAARLRIVETTPPTPMPLLAASDGVDPALVARLRAALLGASRDPEAGKLLAALSLAGFTEVSADTYQPLLDAARPADAAGYHQPG
ncbi:MAG: phosphate/phosphite/phosphonate ABC transporter substrate-binding protein [Beijerinckiaceae bacterium]|nr:phosphate/phosphite/phosphonate ABC transporter substrate-binding protein [Beijerinckiaceae bacterium]